jgi:hypothetical protein
MPTNSHVDRRHFIRQMGLGLSGALIAGLIPENLYSSTIQESNRMSLDDGNCLLLDGGEALMVNEPENFLL